MYCRIIALVACVWIMGDAVQCRGQEQPSDQSTKTLKHAVEACKKIKLGVFRPGTSETLFVPFANTTKSSLFVFGYRKSCTCTSLSFEGDEIPPNSSKMVRIQLEVPKTPGDYGASFTVYTASARNASDAEYADEFSLTFSARDDCTFVPAVPVLSTAISKENQTITIRVINYSGEKWFTPSAEFTPSVPFTSKEAIEEIDGSPRQVLLLSVDKAKLVEHKDEFPPEGVGKLTAYRSFPNGQGVLCELAHTDTRFHYFKNVEVHPKTIALDRHRQKEVALIVVCRVPGVVLSKGDIVVRLSNRKLDDEQFHYEKLSEQWGRLTITADAVQTIDKDVPVVRIEVPKLHVDRAVALLFFDVSDS